MYLLEASSTERDIGAGHLYEVAFFASTLAIANVLARLHSVVNVGDIVYKGLEATTKVLT